VGTLAVAEAAEAVAAQDFESYDTAVALRDELGDALDTLAEAADETAYAPLLALRLAVVQDVSARGADLARVARFVPPRTAGPGGGLPPVRGCPARCRAGGPQPGPAAPGLVPGGQPLEYLRD
jgi:predicted transcriptional regulator